MRALVRSSYIYFSFYFVFVTVTFFNAAQVTKYFENAAAVGYIYSASLLGAIILMIGISLLEDRNFLTAKTMLIITLLVAAVSYAVLGFSTDSKVLGIMYFLNSASVLALPAFIDSYVLDSVKEKKYAQIRAFGSVGAAISYFVSAYLVIGEELPGTIGQSINNFIEANILIDNPYPVIVGINVVLLLSVITVLALSPNVKRMLDLSNLKQVRKEKSQRNLILLFIIAFLTYGVIKADDAYNVLYNNEYAQISAGIIGLIGLVSIGSEAGFMFLYQYVNKYISKKNLLYIAAGTLLFIFWTKYQYYDVKWLVNLGNILFGVYVGFFVPIAIHIISKFGNKKYQTTILSLYQICILAGGFILGLVTAMIFDATNFLPSIYIIHFGLIALSVFFITALKNIE